MKHNLNQLRADYSIARQTLGFANSIKCSKTTKSLVMKELNKCRLALLREIQRVSSIVWPETGRPYCGNWTVLSRVNGGVVYQGPMIQCIKFIERSRYGMNYWISK